MEKFIRICSPKFPILPGEDEELVNEGMYGKALAEYLLTRLREQGYEAPFLCCEDWGWWVELTGFPFTFGVCIYGCVLKSGLLDLYVTDGATASERQWSWRRFRIINTGAAAVRAKLHADLLCIFNDDPEVQVLATDLEGPFVDSETSP
jgi:hypothetical protein